MAYYNNPSPAQPDAKVGPAQPIDDIAANLMQAIHRKGRGFVLSTAANAKDGTTIEVKESLPPHDEWEALAAYRSHTLADAASLTAWIKKYGTVEKSIVFIDTKGAVGLIDDQIARGKRERAKIEWRPAQDWKDWSAIVNQKPMGHKDLYRFIKLHEHNLQDPAMLIGLSKVKSSATVDHESDITDTNRETGVKLKTNNGEQLASFPKTIPVVIPILDDDALSGKRFPAKINVEIIIPSQPLQAIEFRLYCSTWDEIWRSRISDEESSLRKELDGWLVLNGSTGYRRRDPAQDAD